MTDTKPRVLLTRAWPAPVEAAMADRFELTCNEGDIPMTGAALTEALATFDAVCPTVTDKLPPAVLAGASRTRILGNFGVGFNHIDVDAAKEAGLVVTNTPGVLTDATADIALTLLLNVARRTYEAENMLREGRWQGWGPTQLMGTAPQGKVLGIIGMGRIGKAMARRCYHALGMEVVFHNRSSVTDPGIPDARQLGSIEEVLAVSDFVSLHCVGGGANTRMMNAERLARMKPTAFLINTARGDLVDEQALAAALAAGTIAGAGLDVFEQEPAITPALMDMPNVCLLPHLGSATTETRIAMGMKVLDNLAAFFDGSEPPDRVV